MASQHKQNSGLKNQRISAQQKKVRLQQIIMAIVGIIVILAMVLASVIS